MASNDDLDAILDNCLDEFDSTTTTTTTTVPTPANNITTANNNNNNAEEELRNILQMLERTEVGQKVVSSLDEKKLKELLNVSVPTTTTTPPNQQQQAVVVAKEEEEIRPSEEKDPFKRTVQDAMNKMDAANTTSNSNSSGVSNNMDDDAAGIQEFMKMMEELAKMEGDNGNGGGGGGIDEAKMPQLDDFVKKMFEEMISKEYMYEPLKSIAESYRVYISANASTQPKEQIDMYRKQLECVEEMLVELDKNIQGNPKIVQLFDKMHALGEPPKEIASDMLPFQGLGTNVNNNPPQDFDPKKLEAMMNDKDCRIQ